MDQFHNTRINTFGGEPVFFKPRLGLAAALVTTNPAPGDEQVEAIRIAVASIVARRCDLIRVLTSLSRSAVIPCAAIKETSGIATFRQNAGHFNALPALWRDAAMSRIEPREG